MPGRRYPRGSSVGGPRSDVGHAPEEGEGLGAPGTLPSMVDLDAARARRWWGSRAKVVRIDRAAAFVEDVGFALLFPNKGIALPSLYDVASDRPLFSPAGDWGPDAARARGGGGGRP